MFLIFCYLATGAIAGTLAGLLGIGGGIIVVPALADIFLYQHNIPPELYMKMAIGTSLAIMITTLSAGLYAHNKKKSVNWNMVKSILPGLVIGVMVGAIFVHFISSKYLSIFFSLFLMAIGLRLLIKREKHSTVKFNSSKSFSKSFMLICSALIGVLSSILGAGGGTMWVPFFLYADLKMHAAIGTSVACGIVAAIVATISFIIYGLFSYESVPFSTGYIYWPAFAGVSATSMIFAPFGAVLAHRLSTRWLKYLFAICLLLLGIKMIFFTR